MISRTSGQIVTRIAFTVALASIVLLTTAFCQSANPSATARSSSTPAPRYQPNRFPKKAQEYYGLVWGIDSISVKTMESGELVRFTYRVLDANKAQSLNDKKAEPFLVDYRTHAKLVVPSLENVGMLRQTSTPEAGKLYWVAFSNSRGLVKPGDRVSVVIGSFRADGLVVQ